MMEKELKDLKDEELMAIFVLNRDMDAFEVLLDRHKTPLFNYIKKLVGDFHKAEDLLQETFLKIIKNRLYFNGNSSFSTWTYSIATNLCKDEWRKNIVRQKELLGNGYPINGYPINEQPSPESSIIEKNIEEKINAIICLLPQKLRAVYVLASYEDFSYEMISEILNIPLGTVKSRMHNALKLTLRLIKKEGLANDLQ